MPVFVWVLLILLVLTVGFYLYSVYPNRKRKSTAYFASFHYAHRGLHDERIPENSLAAFRAAAEAGYAIELDVQLSRDGVPMVFHDATLARVCGIDRRLSELDAAELEKISLLGRPAHKIPRLSSVLAEVDGRVPLLVEIKGLRDIEAVCAATASLLDDYRGAYCIESFSPFVVHWFRKNRPLVVRGQLSEHYFAKRGRRKRDLFLMQILCTNFLTKPDFISFNCEYRRYLPFRIATALFGAASFAWTVDSVEKAESCCGYFDSMIFEKIRPPRRPIDEA